MNATALVLKGVVARDRAGARGNPRGRLAGLDLEMDKGVIAILGTPEDGTIALFDVLSGVRRLDRGTILVRGEDPAKSWAVRRSIGAVGLVPRLPDGRSVEESVAIALQARGGAGARGWLERTGLGALVGRPSRALGTADKRAIELCLALDIERPSLVVVHEPFLDMARDNDETVLSLASVGERAPVVVLMSSPADAKRFERVAILTRGALARESAAAHGGLGAPLAASLVAWVASGARELASALASRPEVASLILSADSPGGLAVVRLAGTDMDALSLCFAEESARAGALVEALREIPPTLAEITALTEWELRARQLTAMHLAGADARLRAELAQAEAHARAQAFASRAPAWGPAAPAEVSPGVLAPEAPAERPGGGEPSGGEGGRG